MSAFLGFSMFLPRLVSAHVKWFVDSAEIVRTMHGESPFYGWGSKEVIIWGLIVLAVVAFFAVIDRRIPSPKKLVLFAEQHRIQINRVAQAILGLFLITVSFVWKIIIIPEIKITSIIALVFAIIQALIGIMYIFNIFPRIASIGLILFCLGIGIVQGPVAILENAILVSLAVYFLGIHMPAQKKCWIRDHGLEIVRIGTGISLIVLAFTEKLLYPELGLSFLSVHHWNFMQSLFPWFTDKLFVLSVGFAEMIFGMLFILGYVTRITTVLIAIFFGISVTTMLIQFRAWEVEDLVVYTAAVLFIFYGAGGPRFFQRIFPGTILHRRVIGKDSVQ